MNNEMKMKANHTIQLFINFKYNIDKQNILTKTKVVKSHRFTPNTILYAIKKQKCNKQ